MKRAALASPESLPALPDLVGPWPGRLVDLDGSATFVRHTAPTRADAEPALFVHGLGGSSLNWTDLAYLLSDRLDGEAIDLPGFGLSDPGRRYGIPAAAARVIRWIEQSGRGPVHLFGNSLGGSITVWVAGVRPDLVRSLTLISPAMPFFDPRRSLQSPMLPLLVVPGAAWLVAKRVASVPPEELAAQVIEACYAEPHLVRPERFVEAIEEARRRTDRPWYIPAYLRTLRGLVGSFLRSALPGPNSLWRVAGRITAPTLVIAGCQDRLVDIRVSPAVAQCISDSRLLMLGQVGHVAQIERPVMVARAVLGMLDEVAPPTHRPGSALGVTVFNTPARATGAPGVPVQI